MKPPKPRRRLGPLLQARVSPELLAELEAWLADINAARPKGWPPVRQPELVRAVLRWAVRERPDLGKGRVRRSPT